MDYSEIEMRGDLDPLGEAIGKAQDMLQSFADRARSIFKTVTGVEGWDDLFAKIKHGIELFEDSDEGINRLNLALKYTGERAGLTGIQLAEMGDQIVKVSKYTNDAVTDAQRALLDFKNVRGVQYVFQDTLKAATDLAAVMGVDLTHAARTLGEILNDPIKGMQELKDLHISLSDQQKAQIVMFMRWGDIVSAQRVILQAFNDEIGGQGERAANTFSAKMQKLADSTDAVWRSIGQFVVPYLNKAIDVMNQVSLVVTTLAKEFYDSFGPSGMEGYVAAAVKVATEWFWKLVDAGTVAFTALQNVLYNWDEVSAALMVEFKRYSLEALLYVADAAATAWDAVVELSQPAIEYLKGAWTSLKAYVADWAAVATVLVAQAVDAIIGIWDQLVSAAAEAWDAIVQPVIDWGLAAVGAAYLVQAVVVGVFKILAVAASAYVTGVTALFGAWAKGVMEAVGLVTKYIGAVFDFLFVAEKAVLTAAAKVIGSFFEGWKTGGDSTTSYLLGIFDIFGQGVMELVKTLAAGFNGVFGFLRDLGADIVMVALEPLDDATVAMKHKLIDLKGALKGLGGPGGFEMPDFEKPKVDLKGMLDAAKAALAAINAAGGLGGVDLGDNLAENRDKVQQFVDKIQGILDADKYKRFQGGEPFSRFGGFREGGEASSSTGKMEDLFALNRRIQEAAARPPELKELEKQTQIMEEERMIQQATLDHLRDVHKRSTGLNTPKFAMQDLVTPEGLGT